MSKKTQNWAVPLIAVLLGMLIGAVLMLIFGYDPFWAYYDLFSTCLLYTSGFDIINFSVNEERKIEIVTHVEPLVNRVLENINPFDN